MPNFPEIDMKDASTASSRIYVGGLMDAVESDELYELFKEFGNVLGIRVNRGYGFVQFETEQSAQDAIQSKHLRCKGRNLVIKSAMQNKSKPSGGGANETQEAEDMKGGGGGGEEEMEKLEGDGAEMEAGGGGGGEYSEEGYREWEGGEGGYREWEGGEGGYRDRYRGKGRGQRGGFRGPRGGGRLARGGGGYRERSPIHRGSYGDWIDPKYDHYGRMGDIPSAYRPPLPIIEKNDCEIIVVSRMLTEYAEFVEDKLKRLGLVVDLLFPNEDVPIGRVLGNISSRGCLYAILIMPQNLEHRSLTLNILHGLPQEHRNMPLEDALELMGRNWSEYQTSGRAAGRAALMGLLKQLAAGHSLTVLQYDTVLQYVKECREKQVKIELGDAAVDTTSKTQVDLQQRIMSILNSDATKQQEHSLPAPATVAPPTAAAPILNNPTVQKALDSLLSKII